MSPQYLNEERFQKTRKKFILAGVLIMVIGLMAGGLLIAKGFSNKSAVDSQYTEANKQQNIADLQAQIIALQNEVQPKLDEIQRLETQRNTLSPFTDQDQRDALQTQINALQNEIRPIQDQITQLNSDLFQAQNDDVSFDRSFHASSYILLFAVGGFILFTFFAFGAMMLLQAFRRNFLAYGAQTAMPIVKEGIEEITPAVGGMVKEIKKDLDEETAGGDSGASAASAAVGDSPGHIFCPVCGKAIAKDSIYCKACGAKV